MPEAPITSASVGLVVLTYSAAICHCTSDQSFIQEQSMERLHTKVHYHEKPLSRSKPRHDMSSIAYDITVIHHSGFLHLQHCHMACMCCASLRAVVIYLFIKCRMSWFCFESSGDKACKTICPPTDVVNIAFAR